MIRYYQFADICVALEGLPENMEDGMYLKIFRTGYHTPNIVLKIRAQTLKFSEKSEREGNRYFLEKDGKRYLYTWFRTSSPAVMAAQEDWVEDMITVIINREVFADNLFTVNQLLSLSGFSSGLLWRGCMTFHCSYIFTGDRALLFAGSSGAGKSTQAALWEKYRDAEIINGDRALIWRREDGWYVGGISVCGSSKICKNRTEKLAAVILLEKAEKNQVFAMKPAEKYRTIVAGMAFHRRSREETEQAGKLALRLITEISMYRLRNRADEESVEVLEQVIGGALYDI